MIHFFKKAHTANVSSMYPYWWQEFPVSSFNKSHPYRECTWEHPTATDPDARDPDGTRLCSFRLASFQMCCQTAMSVSVEPKHMRRGDQETRSLPKLSQKEPGGQTESILAANVGSSLSGAVGVVCRTSSLRGGLVSHLVVLFFFFFSPNLICCLCSITNFSQGTAFPPSLNFGRREEEVVSFEKGCHHFCVLKAKQRAEHKERPWLTTPAHKHSKLSALTKIRVSCSYN